MLRLVLLDQVAEDVELIILVVGQLATWTREVPHDGDRRRQRIVRANRAGRGGKVSMGRR